MNLKEVVFPVDFSPRSIDVCPYVAAVTRRLQARLTLLHIVEALAPGSSPLDRLYSGDEVEIEQQVDKARHALLAFQQQYIPHMPSQVRVVVGDPAPCIAAYGSENNERLILMPTRGYGPFRRMLLGSVTAKVLHDSRSPVLTGPHLEHAIRPDQWFKLERILCAVALDWETTRILKHSAEFAAHLKATLTVVHVITPLEEGLLPLVNTDGPISAESARNSLEELVSGTAASAEVQVRVGEASRGVACAAREMGADLVVIGRGGAPDVPARLGTHAYGIIRRAPCPVLCV